MCLNYGIKLLYKASHKFPYIGKINVFIQKTTLISINNYINIEIYLFYKLYISFTKLTVKNHLYGNLWETLYMCTHTGTCGLAIKSFQRPSSHCRLVCKSTLINDTLCSCVYHFIACTPGCHGQVQPARYIQGVNCHGGTMVRYSQQGTYKV